MYQTTWRPTANFASITLRAELLSKIRNFFTELGILEVETPILSSCSISDPHIVDFTTNSINRNLPKLYLQSSPESHMKRLIAAGSGCIYQIAKVFRDGEIGRFHNPEFTMLEWYRIGFDYHQLMDEVSSLVIKLIGNYLSLSLVEKISYRDIFRNKLNLDPYNTCITELFESANEHYITIPESMQNQETNIDSWLDLLLTHCIIPSLGIGKLTFIYDYPVSQASCAQIKNSNIPVSERFELYINGLEIANGFSELTDVEEQKSRLELDNNTRKYLGLTTKIADYYLIEAMKTGLPKCSGVALGIDRVIMLAINADSLESVLAFPINRA